MRGGAGDSREDRGVGSGGTCWRGGGSEGQGAVGAGEVRVAAKAGSRGAGELGAAARAGSRGARGRRVEGGGGDSREQ